MVNEKLLIFVHCVLESIQYSSVPSNAFQLRIVMEQNYHIFVGNNKWTTLKYTTIH